MIDRDSRRAARLFATAAFALLLAAAAAACAQEPEMEPAAEILARGIETFEVGDIAGASEVFDRGAAQHPDDAALAAARARMLAALNEYETALPAIDRALELDPGEPDLLGHRLEVFAWGGTLRGRRDWLERAFDVGRELLVADPTRVEAYDMLDLAANGLNDLDRLPSLYAELAADLDHSPVFRIRRLGARLAKARSAADDRAETGIVQEIEAEIARAESELGAAESTTTGPQNATDRAAVEQQYAAAYGNWLLERRDSARPWLERLEKTEAGRHLAGRLAQFSIYSADLRPLMMEVLQNPTSSAIDRGLELTERWMERFPVRWDHPDWAQYRVAGAQRLMMLMMAVQLRKGVAFVPDRPAPEADPDVGGNRTTDELLDEFVALADRLGRLNTWGGAGEYMVAGRRLLQMEERPEAVLRLAETGLRYLDAGRPGLLSPGTRLEERAERAAGLRAGLQRVQGQALQRLGRLEEAEAALRASVEQNAQADRYAALGDLLLERDRPEEAYDAYVAALAWNEQNRRLADAAVVREQALTVLTELESPPESLTADLEAARERVRAAHTSGILGDRVDAAAPDFDLTDIEGRRWRLSELRGKVVILNYWATWCGPCRTELPHYARLVEEYRDDADVVFLAVSTDTDRSAPAEFLAEQGLEFTVLLDEGSATDFGVTGIPAHFILGPEGRIQYRDGGFPGPERYAEEMRLRIESLRLE